MEQYEDCFSAEPVPNSRVRNPFDTEISELPS
jgi:hypothetical protein